MLPFLQPLHKFLVRLWKDDRGQLPIDPATLAQIGTSALGFLGLVRRDRNQTNQTNQLNLLDFLIRQTQDVAFPNFNVGRNALIDIITSGGRNQELVDTFGQIQNLVGRVPGAVGGALQTPAAQTLGPAVQELQNIGQEIGGTRGRTAQLDFLTDRSQDLFGIGRNQFRQIAQPSLELIASGGQTADTRQAARVFQDILANRGQTPQVQRLFNLGTGLVEAGGSTPALQQIQGQFQNIIQQGGLTPEARQFLGPLFDIVASGGRGGAVLPDDVVTSFALANSAAGVQQASEAVRRQAFQRGGAPGTVVDSGLQNQVLADFANEAAVARNQALQQAVLGQQAARLQQLGIGVGGASDILRQAASLVASGQAGLGEVARALASNVATGGNLATGSQQLANQLFGQGAQGLEGILDLENRRQGLGFDAFSNALRNLVASEQAAGTLGTSVEDLVNRRLGVGIDALGEVGGLQSDARQQSIDAILRSLSTQFGGLESLANIGNLFGERSRAAGGTLFGGSIDLLNQIPSLANSRGQTLSQQTGPGLLRTLGQNVLGNLGKIDLNRIFETFDSSDFARGTN